MIGSRRDAGAWFEGRYPVRVRLARALGSGLVLSGIVLSAFALESSVAIPTQLASSATAASAAGGFDACSGADFSLGNAGYFGLYTLGAHGVASRVANDDTTGAAAFGGTVYPDHFVVNNNNVGGAKLYKDLALYAPHAIDTPAMHVPAFILDGGDYNTNLNKEYIDDNGGSSSTVAVPIASDNAQLYNDSTSWGKFSQTIGSKITQQSTSIVLTGTNAALNVFDLSAENLSAMKPGTTVAIDVPDTSTVLINVPGAAPNLDAITTITGVRASQILWNFDAATTVFINSSVQWKGAFLAPYASLAGSSQMDGNVVVNAFTESASSEVHGDASLFVGCIPPSQPAESPVVSITKDVSVASSGTYGSLATFTSSSNNTAYFKVMIANATSVDATGVVVSDPYAAGFSKISSFSCTTTSGGPCPAGLTATALTGSGATITVPANTTYVISFSEAVLANAGAMAVTYMNTATITPPTDGSCTPVSPGTTDCSASATVGEPAPSITPPVVSIAKLMSLTPASAGTANYTSTTQSFAASTGGPAYFEIEVDNATTTSASVDLSDPLASGFSVPSSAIVACASSSGACPSGDTLSIGASGIPSTPVMVPAKTTLYFTFSETVLANGGATSVTDTNTATITPPTDGSCTPVSTGTTDCSASVSVIVPVAAPVTSPSTSVVPPPTSSSAPKPVTSPSSTVVVPTTHTGEPWSGNLWWIGFGGIGILGGAIVSDGYRRRRRTA